MTIDDFILSVILVTYTIITIFVTKYLYHYMIKKGITAKDSLYYNRKFVHILAGGIVTLFIPFYSTPLIALLAGILLTLITLFSHRKGDRMYWFQTDKNYNDVSFCFMWGISIFVLWMLLGYSQRWIAIIPAAYMAFGDGVTGIVRNALYNHRSKHPIGNLFMGLVCIPIGYVYAGIVALPLAGVLSAIAASLVERFEFGPIDDNILITISSALILYISSIILL
ncbi:MAG: hypothetical protein R6U21_01070 [Thermoplasmatota archaeon]